jgi:tetratricopeptide (TPR) repeat protein
VRKLTQIGLLLCLGSPIAAQQTSVQGQVFLPNGQPLAEVIRLTVAADDPRAGPQYYFTDGQGRFIIRGLSPLKPYTITIEGDGRRFATTVITFYAQARGYVPVSLRPLEEKRAPKPGLISATSYKSERASKLYREALRDAQNGKLKSAEEKLRRAIEEDPEFTEAYNELALVQINKKEYAAAEALLRRALLKDPQSTDTLLNLGICLNYLARHREAKEPLAEALKQNPNLISAHVHLGIALLETDQIAEAEPHLLRGMGASGRDQALAYLYLGKLYAQVGDVDKAVANWKVYLQLDPHSPNAERVRALLVQLGHPVNKR